MLAGAGTAVWAGGWPSIPDAIACFAFFVFFGHHRVLRWRPRSLIIAGGLAAALLAFGVVTLLDHLNLLPHRWTIWPYLLAPWPGHLAAATWSHLGPRRPLAFSNGGRWKPAAVRALRQTPACPYRLARDDDQGALRLALPRNPAADLCTVLETPLGALPLLPEGPEEGMGRTTRRTLELVLILATAPLAIPLTLILALLTRLLDGTPSFYGQIRMTMGGHLFTIHKLRSMVRDAEADGTPIWPEKDDPRITPLGRFLRRFWLDELPQLWDVLRGPLSLVGPRPERPYFVEEFSSRLPIYPLRHQVRAGITGLAQVSGFVGNTSIERRLHADLRYIKRWSPWLDLQILVATVYHAARRPPIHRGEVRSQPKPPSTST